MSKWNRPIYWIEHIKRVYLDEAKSILAQFCSPLHGNHQKENRAKFIALLQNAEKVVITDDDLDQTMFDFIFAYRDPSNAFVSINDYKLGSRINENGKKMLGIKTAKVFRREATLDLKIKESLNKGEKLVIASGTKTYATTIHKNLTEQYPNLNIRLYTSDTADHKEELNDVNNTWDKFDVLIYSPAISAGISFRKYILIG